MPLLPPPPPAPIVIKPDGNFRYSLVAPYREEAVRLLSAKQSGPPGMGFRDNPKRWLFGADLVPYVEQVCRGVYGYCQVARRDIGPLMSSVSDLTAGMHPFQLQGLERIVTDRGHGLFFEQGLGKTRPALVSAKALGITRVLAVVPPRMPLDWTMEVRKWLGPDPKVWTPKKPGDVPGDDVNIAILPVSKLSYTSVPVFQHWLKQVGLVLIDECQFYKDYKSERTKMLKAVLDLNPASVRVIMSGTPLPDRVSDLYQPADIAFPWLFGKRDAFNVRYLKPEINKAGYTVYKELAGRNDEELRERVAAMSTRARKRDYAHLLPSFTLTRLEVDVTLPSGYQSPDMPSEAAALREMELLKVPKAKAAVLRTKEIIADEEPEKFVVLTYHRDAAEAVWAQLSEQHPDYKCVLIWGGLTHKEFNARIDEAVEPGVKCILVANMSAIETGLNRLVCFARGILAELYFRPATVSQPLSRFHRLTSRFPVTFDVLFCANTLDEKIYWVLRNKLDDIDRIIGSGDSETQIMGLDQDNWQAELASALAY